MFVAAGSPYLAIAVPFSVSSHLALPVVPLVFSKAVSVKATVNMPFKMKINNNMQTAAAAQTVTPTETQTHTHTQRVVYVYLCLCNLTTFRCSPLWPPSQLSLTANSFTFHFLLFNAKTCQVQQSIERYEKRFSNGNCGYCGGKSLYSISL